MKKLAGILFFLLLIVQPSGTPSRSAAADGAAAEEEYCGEYFLSSGQRVSVFRTGVLSELARLTFINWENGRVGTLSADGADRFWAAFSRQQSDVRQTDIAFVRDDTGKVRHLTIKEGTGEAVRAERKETFTETSVQFANGDVILSGALKTPRGGGPFPAVILVHGSGPGTREQYESIARFFVHLGLAVVSYDKRGCGASTGDWKAVDLDSLADDAAAAVSWLETNRAIDPRRIGLWGISQGGWIVPLAAARSDRVAFVINHSGPGTSPRRQDTYMMANELRDQGIPPDDVDLVIAGMNTLYDYGQKKATAQALDAAIERLRGKPGLEEFAGYSSRMLIPDSMYKYQKLGDPAWFFHLDPDRDALEPYRRLRCPLLVVYGRLDYTVPVEESEEKIAAVLRESGHPDYTVEVLDRAGHGTIMMRKEEPRKQVEPLSIVPEYYSLLEGWLRTRGFCGAAPSAADRR